MQVMCMQKGTVYSKSVCISDELKSHPFLVHFSV